jgi:hypothetical protein
LEGGEVEKDRARGGAFATRELLVGPSTIALEGRPVDCGLLIRRFFACRYEPEMLIELFEDLFEAGDIGLSEF